MSANLKLLDTFRLVGSLNTNFACGLSQDDRIFIISDIGLYIIAQKPNLNSVFSEYSCHKYFLEPSPFALCDNVDIDINSFVYELPKDILYESTAWVGLTHNLRGVADSMPSILFAQWSEANMVDYVDSMLGVLTNLYSLEIYIKSVNESNLTEYKMITNLTNEIILKQKADFVYSNKMPAIQKMRELKKRLEYIAPTIFEWSHTFAHEGENCAVIFIGHFHGAISAWRVSSCDSCDKNTHCNFLFRYNSKMGNISTLYWHRTDKRGGALCVGDSDGKISVLQITNLGNSDSSVDNEIELFSEKDRNVDKISVMTFKSYTILIAVKQSYLLIYGLNLAGQVFDFVIYDVRNFYITGITHKKNIMQVLTFTGIFKELRVSIQLGKIIIDDVTIPVKFEFSGYRTHGYTQSSNKILYAFILSPCRLKNSINGRKFVNFCLFNDANLSPLKLLLENKSGTLRTFWDCFEALRLICLREQRFPWLGLNSNLELDNLSLSELKTLRLIAKLSETVFGVVKRVVSYAIKPYILLHYLLDLKLTTQRLARLFENRNAGKTLSLWELRSIDLQVFFIKEMVISGILAKAEVGATFLKEISHILAVANELKYPDRVNCNFCGEKLIGSMCLPPHADSRCVFTLMPIFISPSYKCPLCNSLVHKELEQEVNPIFCPYCDCPMEKINLDGKIKENMNDFETVFSQDGMKSKCNMDCVTDSKEALDELFFNLEDNEMVFINISDNEEEDEQNELEKIYFKLADIKLDTTNKETCAIESSNSNFK